MINEPLQRKHQRSITTKLFFGFPPKKKKHKDHATAVKYDEQNQPL